MFVTREMVRRMFRPFIKNETGNGDLLGPYEAEDISIMQFCKPYTMTDHTNLFGLMNAVRYVEKNKIEGSFVECGVWRGGCVMAMTETLRRMGSRNRNVYLYDTYEGMPEPSDLDVRDSGEIAKVKYVQLKDKGEGWCYSSLEDVKSNLALVDYDPALIHFIKGKVEETIPATAPARIALLRLDTDWYESTNHALSHLFPRLSIGGVLMLDDYGTWRGARKAVDEYLESNGIPLLLNPLNKTVRIAVKVRE